MGLAEMKRWLRFSKEEIQVLRDCILGAKIQAELAEFPVSSALQKLWVELEMARKNRLTDAPEEGL